MTDSAAKRAYLIFTVAFVMCHYGCGSNGVKPSKPFRLPQAGAETQTSLKIGDQFPVLNVIDLDGNEVVLGPELFGDRATLIVFWSTWCGFCMKDLPHEIDLSQRYADSGLRVIGINADDTPEIAKDAVAERRIPWPNVYEGPRKTISKQLGISAWPTLYLLDRDGTIISSTPYLRAEGIEVLPDGTTRQINSLDWTLEEVLRTLPERGLERLGHEKGDITDFGKNGS